MEEKNSDSVQQQKQEQQNSKEKESELQKGDKKLAGPNYPAT